MSTLTLAQGDAAGDNPQPRESSLKRPRAEEDPGGKPASRPEREDEDRDQSQRHAPTRSTQPAAPEPPRGVSRGGRGGREPAPSLEFWDIEGEEGEQGGSAAAQGGGMGEVQGYFTAAIGVEVVRVQDSASEAAVQGVQELYLEDALELVDYEIGVWRRRNLGERKAACVEEGQWGSLSCRALYVNVNEFPR